MMIINDDDEHDDEDVNNHHENGYIDDVIDHVQRREKQGKSRRWVQRGVWCWSGCSSGLCS